MSSIYINKGGEKSNTKPGKTKSVGQLKWQEKWYQYKITKAVMLSMLRNFFKPQPNEDRYRGYKREFLEKKNI